MRNSLIPFFLFLLFCKQSDATNKKDAIVFQRYRNEAKNFLIDTGIRHPVIKNAIEIPILCYHNIHERTSKNSPLLTITVPEFSSQMKSLFDSGYNTISPDQLYQYLTEGI